MIRRALDARLRRRRAIGSALHARLPEDCLRERIDLLGGWGASWTDG